MNVREIEAQRWFKQAQADLEAVRALQAAGHHAAACFYAQQAAEKALKAVLYGQGKRVVLGHSVRDLTGRCAEYDRRFADVVEVCSSRQ
jgi:HEPN domain-containing protein